MASNVGPRKKYDVIASVYDGRISSYHIKRLTEIARPTEGELIVDIGTGTGIVLHEISETIGNHGIVCGIDISINMLRMANRSKGKNVALIQGDAAKLPFRDESVNLVVSNLAFHHLDDQAKSKSLAECYRMLAKRGRFVNQDLMLSNGIQRINASVEAMGYTAGRAIRLVKSEGLRAAIWSFIEGLRYFREFPSSSKIWRTLLSTVGFREIEFHFQEPRSTVTIVSAKK